MNLTEAQKETMNNLESRGFHLNQGTPCECGPEPYKTRRKVGYSDYVTYYHTCTECGNEFSTYIEG